jgi:hypothetical protein
MTSLTANNEITFDIKGELLMFIAENSINIDDEDIFLKRAMKFIGSRFTDNSHAKDDLTYHLFRRALSRAFPEEFTKFKYFIPESLGDRWRYTESTQYTTNPNRDGYALFIELPETVASLFANGAYSSFEDLKSKP